MVKNVMEEEVEVVEVVGEGGAGGGGGGVGGGGVGLGVGSWWRALHVLQFPGFWAPGPIPPFTTQPLHHKTRPTLPPSLWSRRPYPSSPPASP